MTIVGLSISVLLLVFSHPQNVQGWIVIALLALFFPLAGSLVDSLQK